MTHRLKSGNTFECQHENVPGRGGIITGSFRAAPSGADIEEATDIQRALVPAGNTLAYESITKESDTDAMDRQKRQRDGFRNMLYGGSSN